MRVLIATGLYPPEIGGPATYAKLFEERLPRYGIEVSVLPFSTVRHLPSIIRHIVYCWEIIQASQNMSAILVQDTVSTGFPAAIASIFTGKPLILRVPGDYAWEQGVQRFDVKESLDEFQTRSYGIAVAVLRAVQRFVVRHASRVIAPSKYLGRIIEGWVPTKHIDVIYNGIETLAQIGTRRENSLIVSAGRLVPWKGFKELIDLMPRHPDWRLEILGDGPLRSELEDHTWEIKVEKQVTFAGKLSHDATLQEFAKASVFVLNSLYEGLSHTLIEAMATSAPVIATRVGGNPEVVNDDINGTLVEAGDSTALEKAIVKLFGDPELRERLGEAAAMRAKDFSIDKTIEATARLLQKVMNDFVSPDGLTKSQT